MLYIVILPPVCIRTYYIHVCIYTYVYTHVYIYRDISGIYGTMILVVVEFFFWMGVQGVRS